MKLAWIAVLCVACGNHDQPPLKSEERQPRVIDPPPQGVRALPPHAIRGDGVGPYRLGVPLEQLGRQVPSGARNAQVDIPNVVHLSVLHAEEDAILIGTADPIGRASFVSVVRGDIARTESGIHVGSTRDELVRALGAPVVELDRARDPHVIVPSGLRELRAVIKNDRVVGMVIAAAEPAPKEPPKDDCPRPVVDADDTMRAPRQRFGACLSPGGEIVTLDDELTVRTADGNKPLPVPPIPGIVFAAPLRNPDGRDDLVVIAQTEDAQSRTWFLFAYRYDGTRLVKAVDPMPMQVYRLTAANARWIGSALDDLDLELEVTSRGDAIEVGGLLTTHAGDKLSDLVVLSPVPVTRRHAKSAMPEATDAGITDAAEAAPATRTRP